MTKLFRFVGANCVRPPCLPLGEGGTAQAVTDEGHYSSEGFRKAFAAFGGYSPHQSKIKDF
jgi:hypothetical protein